VTRLVASQIGCSLQHAPLKIRFSLRQLRFARILQRMSVEAICHQGHEQYEIAAVAARWATIACVSCGAREYNWEIIGHSSRKDIMPAYGSRRSCMRRPPTAVPNIAHISVKKNHVGRVMRQSLPGGNSGAGN